MGQEAHGREKFDEMKAEKSFLMQKKLETEPDQDYIIPGMQVQLQNTEYVMQLTFGMFLDGADWTDKAASLGEITMGPMQFLSWLESRLGLGGVSVSAPERINEYMQRIREYIRRNGKAWCKASFELDAWSTAKQMLSWRDELIENGWDGKSGKSERLKALAALEAEKGPLSPGIPDRIKTILTELTKYSFSDTLVLQEPLELLPYLWKQVVTQLRKSGMDIREAEEAKTGDPEMIQLNGANEFVLAKECVRFLAAGGNKRTAIICQGDSAILDGVFHRNGIGRLNAAERSRWRESLQILPLWLETLWAPFDPQRFLELLLLPCTPIPKKLARELVKALQKEPGYGGEAWNNAWKNVQNGFAEDAESGKLQKLESVWNMLNEKCFCAKDEASSETISDRCDFLIRQLAVRIENHPELALVIEHAKTLKKIVAGRRAVKRMELARILDSIISTGTSGDRAGRERTDFAVFSHPGLIDRDFDTVLWWNFMDAGGTDSTNWTQEEIAVLPGYDPAAARKRENRSWHNALKHAEKSMIFFVPQMMDGNAAFPHPLLDELDIPEKNIVTPEKLTDSAGKWTLAGRTVSLKEVPLFKPAVKARIEKNSIRPIRRLSYSQLNTLISCPFQWFMQDFLGLELPPAMTVPTGSPMLGTLAHKVIEEIYKGKETLTVKEAVQKAERKFEELLPSMAAELLLDGRNVERQRILRTLLDAVKVLVTEINERKLLVKGNEKELHGTFENLDFLGFSDIYLEDASGNKFVIDMKWSTSSYYKKHLEEDKALQLATYSWLLDPEGLRVKCAYFLFPRKQLVFDSARTWNTLWNNAKEAWKQRFEEIRSGRLARGIAEENDLDRSNSPLPLAAGCAFCDYAALCGMMEEE